MSDLSASALNLFSSNNNLSLEESNNLINNNSSPSHDNNTSNNITTTASVPIENNNNNNNNNSSNNNSNSNNNNNSTSDIEYTPETLMNNHQNNNILNINNQNSSFNQALNNLTSLNNVNNHHIHHHSSQQQQHQTTPLSIHPTSSPHHSNNSSTSSSPSITSPYKKPLSLTKDRIPTHLHHYLDVQPSQFDKNFYELAEQQELPSDDRNDDSDVREVTPATITLRSLNQQQQQSTNNTIPLNNIGSINQTTNTQTTSPTNPTTTTPPSNGRRRKSSNSNNNNNNPNSTSPFDRESHSPLPNSSNALATIPQLNENGEGLSLANVMSGDRTLSRSGQNYIEITEFLNFPQSEAAKKLGIPTSTLSKRWKEAARGRKWPFRKVSKIDKEIMTLLHNIPAGSPNPDLPPDVDASLVALLKKRQEKLKPVFIRM